MGKLKTKQCQAEPRHNIDATCSRRKAFRGKSQMRIHFAALFNPIVLCSIIHGISTLIGMLGLDEDVA